MVTVGHLPACLGCASHVHWSSPTLTTTTPGPGKLQKAIFGFPYLSLNIPASTPPSLSSLSYTQEVGRPVAAAPKAGDSLLSFAPQLCVAGLLCAPEISQLQNGWRGPPPRFTNGETETQKGKETARSYTGQQSLFSKPGVRSQVSTVLLYPLAFANNQAHACPGFPSANAAEPWSQ